MSASSAATATLDPSRLLTHHAIMALIEPFSRKGYQVDLEASDRTQGRVAFRTIEFGALRDGHPPLRCTLQLERIHRLKFRVSRTLQTPDGLSSAFCAEGDDPAVLLERLDALSPRRQFHLVGHEARGAFPSEPMPAGSPHYVLARSYRIEAWSREMPQRRIGDGTASRPQLTDAEAQIGPVRVMATQIDSRTLEVRLICDQGTLDVPNDFLAVLGWSWRPVRRADRNTWIGNVWRSGWEPGSTARLERHLDRLVIHLSDTLQASPSQFHRRHRVARYRAAFQRCVPSLIVAGIIGGLALAVTYLPKTPLVHELVFHAFLLGVLVLALMDRSYRIEVPAPPQPLSQAGWYAPESGERAES